MLHGDGVADIFLEVDAWDRLDVALDLAGLIGECVGRQVRRTYRGCESSARAAADWRRAEGGRSRSWRSCSVASRSSSWLGAHRSRARRACAAETATPDTIIAAQNSQGVAYRDVTDINHPQKSKTSVIRWLRVTAIAKWHGSVFRPEQRRRLLAHERKIRRESKMSGGLLPEVRRGGQEQSRRALRRPTGVARRSNAIDTKGVGGLLPVHPCLATNVGGEFHVARVSRYAALIGWRPSRRRGGGRSLAGAASGGGAADGADCGWIRCWAGAWMLAISRRM